MEGKTQNAFDTTHRKFDISIYRKSDILIYRKFRYDIPHSHGRTDRLAVAEEATVRSESLPHARRIRNNMYQVS